MSASEPQLRVGIVGLGLIGGSFARAYRAAGAEVLAFDVDRDILEAARVDTIAGELDADSLGTVDLVVLAAYPHACLEWLEAHAEALASASNTERGTGPLVIDTAGVKSAVCERAFELARAHGFAFVGAHPMAGTENSGFAYARADLFRGAPMVLVPPEVGDLERLMLLDRAHTLLAPIGFGSFSVTTPEEHDRTIAFTSQLAHVVSNAYVKSPTAQGHHGFSAGSYRDLTRVAHLNPAMWAELMCENAENLSRELTWLIDALDAYRTALDAGDPERLRMLLAEGDRIKRSLDDGDERA
ncbi:prephenate dehydrogenase/arogenate dehydrogenase family protein [Enorma burkinafasonensis]|uniref:prephenate dehydrogenase n=1 Tax=Enorma burkinafasonensis TaxID=2590867 RepID=UPI0026F23C59|nr:prephenate dehydrogenase/arogenate dehydrogenase family protein [Enorma burkinafasonensis]MCI7731270.1 prephenate dehydrogenase/arogenate dehydrogenase family protein [Enorma burkinafasonensis]